jgi:hypothetical protein
MADCYRLELVAECAAPMLPSAAAAYVLTLHRTETFARLHGVARRTYVQRNESFRTCAKGCVSVTSEDLTHAYVRLFATIRDEGPVVVFEDDAELLSTAAEDLAAIDAFVATREFRERRSVYSLGSAGFTVPCGGGHWRYLKFHGMSHAVIYSDAARAHVARVRPCEVLHVDVHVLGAMGPHYTFHRPVAVQRLGETENSRSWLGRPPLSPLKQAAARVVRWLIRTSEMDTAPRAAFEALYVVQRAHVLALVAAVGIAIAVAIVRLVVRAGAAKGAGYFGTLPK